MREGHVRKLSKLFFVLILQSALSSCREGSPVLYSCLEGQLSKQLFPLLQPDQRTWQRNLIYETCILPPFLLTSQSFFQLSLVFVHLSPGIHSYSTWDSREKKPLFFSARLAHFSAFLYANFMAASCSPRLDPYTGRSRTAKCQPKCYRVGGEKNRHPR